jgi:electron transport complex protein RnfB
MSQITAEQIDALLPQTQCGQCGYGGCMPYAKAIEQGEAINRCPPGGTDTLIALAQLLQQEISTADIEAIRQQEKPLAQARIRADECIGCTKCIQACPVDAIVGAAKQLHTVLENECTGCGLCVEPCPVDCIDMLPLQEKNYKPDKARQRFQARQLRLQKIAKMTFASPVAPTFNIDKKKAYIEAAVARARHKKNSP